MTVPEDCASEFVGVLNTLSKSNATRFGEKCKEGCPPSNYSRGLGAGYNRF